MRPQRQRRRHQHDLRDEQDRAAVVAVGERTGERAHHGRREERGERAHAHPDRRVRELVEHVGHGDRLHPRAGVRAAARPRRRGRSRGARSAASAPPELPRSSGAWQRRRSPARIYRDPSPNVCSIPALGWCRWWCRANARCSPRVRSPSTPTPRWERLALDDASWVDVCRGLLLGADTVLDVVVGAVPVAVRSATHVRPHGRRPTPLATATAERRPELVPHPVLARVRDGLAARYGVALGARRSTTTATVATAWRPTATASCATPTTRSSASSPSAPPDRSASDPHGRHRRSDPRPRARIRRRARDGRRVPARLGARACRRCAPPARASRSPGAGCSRRRRERVVLATASYGVAAHGRCRRRRSVGGGSVVGGGRSAGRSPARSAGSVPGGSTHRRAGAGVAGRGASSGGSCRGRRGGGRAVVVVVSRRGRGSPRRRAPRPSPSFGEPLSPPAEHRVGEHRRARGPGAPRRHAQAEAPAGS